MYTVELKKLLLKSGIVFNSFNKNLYENYINYLKSKVTGSFIFFILISSSFTILNNEVDISGMEITEFKDVRDVRSMS